MGVNYLIRLLIAHRRKWLVSSALISLIALAAGCQAIGYYKQAISGQMEMLSHQHPLAKLIADPETPPQLKEKFQLVLALRKFAETKLSLPADGHYLSYVDLHRSNAVWNVYAAPEFSLEPKSWWFPIVGRVTYRGYFSEAAAQTYAAKLRKQGFDIFVGGVDAYSTLGWFKDPVLNTFIDDSERRLAALIFHELAHQRLFISGDTEFNEAFATAVAEEGVRRWLIEKNDRAALEKYRTDLRRKKQFVVLIQDARAQLNAIYEDADLKNRGGDFDVAAMREKKNSVLKRLRENYWKLKQEWGGYSAYDDWFDESLNNAHLNTVATYYDLVPVFHQFIRDGDGKLSQFFAEVKKFSNMSKEKRRRALSRIKINGTNHLMAPTPLPKRDEALPR